MKIKSTLEEVESTQTNALPRKYRLTITMEAGKKECEFYRDRLMGTNINKLELN